MLVNMKEMLEKAVKGKYGVGFFNAVNVEMALSVIGTAEETRSPVMIGTAEVLLPFMSLENVASYLIPMAKRASVPVCVHYDHGLTFEKCAEAVELGFTSVMYDRSTLPYEENVESVAKMVRFCHAAGVTVEGELGHVGDNEGEGKLKNPSDFFTDPAVAGDYARRTGVDALAVAVGNAHGDYAFPPKLDLGRVGEIASLTGIPLVLHGGSGIDDDSFREAVRAGIAKINVFTDLDKAGKAGIEKGLSEGAGTVTSLMPYEIRAMKAAVKEKMTVFGSGGRG